MARSEVSAGAKQTAHFGRTANALAESLRGANDNDALREALDQTAAQLGFDYFAICHYVVDPQQTMVINFTHMPVQWESSVSVARYWTHCPIAAACRAGASAFAWSDLATLIELNDMQRCMLKRAEECGICEGYSVPANIPNSISGSVSFALRSGRELPLNALPLAHFLGAIAYDASVRVTTAAHLAHQNKRLSQRQLDCAILIAHGKTDWEIGQILGISKETAHKHIQGAMRRLGVTTRTQLVVRALFDSQLSMGDVVN